MKKLILSALAVVLVLLISCDKKTKKTDDEATFGSLNLKFENVVNDQPLSLNAQQYLNSHGDTFNVTRYAYYVSNLELIKEDNSSYKVPESYYLIVEGEEASKSYTNTNIPTGTYTKVRVMLGVDSLHNVSGAQSGVLDPINGMFWDWNTGYIMAKLEGFSPQSSGANGLLSFHLGGYSGIYSVLKTVEYQLPQPLVISKDGTSTINFKSDILKWFTGDYPVDFQQLYSTMSIGADAFFLSENYKKHLSVTSVNN